MTMKLYKKWIQHMTNPLHVYCRLIDFGLSSGISRRLSVFYERHFYAPVSKDLGKTWKTLIKRSW
jgi:hypothetical protein